MERIVSGIAKINFHQNCEDILVENHKENMATCVNEVAEAGSEMVDGKFNTSTVDSDLESEFNSSSETAIVGDDDVDSDCSASTAGSSISQRRNLPRRACKENKLKLKRRSIMKPKRHTSRSCDFSMLRPAEIKKIYCNKKLSFRPSGLETIFEEPQPESRRRDVSPVASNANVRFIGLKKIRRSLSCSDGLNTTKTLVKQRRAKIKKIFGRRSVGKKISLNDFIDRLNKSFGDEDLTENSHGNNPPEEPMEAEMSTTSAEDSVTENLHNSTTHGGTNPSFMKTDLAMHLEMGLDSVQERKNNNEDCSLYLVSNKFGTLTYSSDTVDASLPAASVTPNCLGGIR